MDPRLIVFLFCLNLLTCTYNPPEPEVDHVEYVTEPDVLTHEAIDSVFAQFEMVRFKDLDTAYLSYSDPNKKFRKKFKGLEYYVVNEDDLFKKIVGPFRVVHFLSRDKYYRDALFLPGEEREQYWAANKEVYHMLLDLILALEEKGYNGYAFSVTAGHRHPYYNQCCRGAVGSQHQYGTAIDISIHDINRDGEATMEDKQLVLDLLEEIVDDDGGLGLYPSSMSVHLDCRGFKARWNSYTTPY